MEAQKTLPVCAVEWFLLMGMSLCFNSSHFPMDAFSVSIQGRDSAHWTRSGHCIIFMVMGTLSYYFTDYVDGLVYYENWKEFMVELLNWDALRFYDQYIITVGIYYVIRYFQGLQKEEKEKVSSH